MATTAQINSLTSLYVGYFDRAPDPAGLQGWIEAIDAGVDTKTIAGNFATSAEATALYPYLETPGLVTPTAFVESIYLNLFNRTADTDGRDYWVEALTNGRISPEEMILEIIGGAQGSDQTILDNKIEAGLYFSQTAASTSGYSYEIADAKTAIDGVTEDAATVTAAKAATDTAVSSEANVGEALTLTQRADNLQGTAGDDVFAAPVTQDETGSGAVANTFETGDVLDGGEGRDVLDVDLTSSLSGAVPIAPTISATTDSIEVVNLRAQFSNLPDTTIDAEKMSGVEEWWSDNSRSLILVEDVRSDPADTAFGMRDTDPGVNFASFINANFLEGGTEVGASAFNFIIQEANALGNELNDITVNGVRFELNGESFELGGADVEAANTWAELETALQASIDATAGLEGLTVEHSDNGNFVVTDPAAGDFIIDPDDGTVISSSTTNEVKDASLGVPQVTDLPTETSIFLDGAGNGSQGGIMDVGVMSGDRGVEVFNTTVLSDSHITGLQSSSLRTGDQYLEEVYVEGEGDLTLGNTDNTFQGRALNGLTNVRVLDASGLNGSLNAGIFLNANADGRYLDEADDTVNFEYTGTANDDVLSINVDQAIAGDADFAMQVDAGAGDDTINLVNNSDLIGVSLNGGEGQDTLETSSDIGVDEDSTPVAFADIENLVLTGTNTDADMEMLDGVESVTIATGGSSLGGGDSTVSNLEADTTLTISGERQTQDNDSNDDQNFGVITLTDAQATSQLINIDNTARVDGELTVGGLTVDGANSAVREMTLNSGGSRETTNVVNNINAALVTNLEVSGSQALAADVDTMGQDASGVAQEFTVNGAALEGDLDLDIEADLITASNAEGETVTLTGTAGEDDTLTLGGNSNPQDITSDTTVTGFETVVLDEAFEGDLDADNFNGVDLYYVESLGAPTTVTNLKAGDNVAITDRAIPDQDDLRLEGSGSGAIDILFDDPDENGFFAGYSFDPNFMDLEVSQFESVNLELDNLEGSGPNEQLEVNLGLDGQEDNANAGLTLTGDASDYNSTNADIWVVDDVVKNLTITGGNASDDDSLELTTTDFQLPASMDKIDVSGFEGDFTATLGNAVIEDPSSAGDAIAANTDTTFVLNENDANITLVELQAPAEPDGVDFNSIFEFTGAPATQDGGNPAATWTIDNFVAADFTGADNDNFSILDVSDLDIESFAELDFDDDGSDVTITEEGGNSTWEIVLTGVQEADLDQADNFVFA